ncbi:hypothetical protein REPUB_Repub15cG0145800 [Reevesia pubescens]
MDTKCFSSWELREELELEYDFIFKIPPHGIFPRLKVLHVKARNPNYSEFLNSLFLSCPVLEDLSISGNLGHDGDASTFRISIPTLKRLKVELTDDSFQYCSNHKFIIETPSLESLTIIDESIASFVIDEIPLTLRETNVTIGYSTFVHQDEVSKDHEARRVMKILKGITNVRVLTLSASTTSALSHAFNDDLPTFPYLLRLELGIDHYYGWKLLPHFLEISPIIEFLALERESRQILNTALADDEELAEPEVDFGWIPPKSVPDCLLEQLKEIRMRNLWRSEDEVEVVKYLLKNGKVLEKMSINFDEDAIYIDQVLNEDMIEKFPIGSDKCEFEFVN